MDEQTLIILREDGAYRGALTEAMTRVQFDRWALNWALAADALTAESLIEEALTRFERGELAAALGTPSALDLPPIFAQRDEPWNGRQYTEQSLVTFGEGGCYVCSLASLVAWCGYPNVDPLEVALALDERGAFTGAELMRPEVLSRAYPILGGYRRVDWAGPADIAALRKMLAGSPVVAQWDFKASWALEPHFGVVYEYVPDPEGGRNDGLLVMDPWDGAYLDAAADVRVDASGKRAGGGYFWPVWWEGADMNGTAKTRVQRLLWGARYFDMELAWA